MHRRYGKTVVRPGLTALLQTPSWWGGTGCPLPESSPPFLQRGPSDLTERLRNKILRTPLIIEQERKL